MFAVYTYVLVFTKGIFYPNLFRYNDTSIVWHSGPIVETIHPHRVKTKSSSEYVLVGSMDYATAVARGEQAVIIKPLTHECYVRSYLGSQWSFCTIPPV